MLRRISLLTLALTACGLLFLPGTGRAVCSYFDLSSGVVRLTANVTEYERMNQLDPYWMAVGTRALYLDWDYEIYSTTDPTNCVANQLARSARTTRVDFVVGDFNHNVRGMYYGKDINFTGGLTGSSVEWDAGANQIYVNGPTVERTTGADDVLECWDVYFEAGKTYRIVFEPAGAGDSRLLLFRNSGGGTYWAPRNSAVLELTGTIDYTAPATDYYGVVVVNDNGESGSYRISIGRCETPVALTNGTSVFGPDQSDVYTFNQDSYMWAAVGSRAVNPADDYDVEWATNGTGGTWPQCTTGSLAGSARLAGSVDFVVGDFNFNTLGTYAHRGYLYRGVGSLQGQRTQWSKGVDVLDVNETPLLPSFAATDVVRAWDVFLEAGQQYEIDFHSNTGSPNDLTCLVFENPADGAYWAGRGQANLSTKDVTTYTPTRTGFHGVVVVNDTGVSGTFRIGVNACYTPKVLADGVSASMRLPVDFVQFTKTTQTWGALAVRRPSNQSFSLGIYGSATGADPPECLGNLVTQSGWGAEPLYPIDFFAGDFHAGKASPQTFYGRAESQGSTPNLLSYAEWEDTPTLLTVGAAAQVRTASLNDLIELFEASLQAGHRYSLLFKAEGGAALRWTAIAPATAAPYWVSGGFVGSDASAVVDASTTGTYLFVVANQTGNTGSYQIGIYRGEVDVPGAVLPGVTAFRGVTPNPARGARRLDFDLNAPGEVSFDVVDVSGRRVAAVPAARWEAGTWSVPWDGRGAAGEALRAGVYFVRMRCDGREIGWQKAAIVD